MKYMTNMLPFFRDKTEGPVAEGAMEFTNCIGLRKVEGADVEWQPFMCIEKETLDILIKENPGEWIVMDNLNRKPRAEQDYKIEAQAFQHDISKQMKDAHGPDYF